MNGRMNEREGIATDQGKMDGPHSMKRARAARHRRLEIRRMRSSRSDGQDLEQAKRARRERRGCEQECLLSGSDTGSSEPLMTSSSSEEDLEGIIRAGGSVRSGILVAGGWEDAETGMPCRSHGSVSLCGRRREMEDAVTVAPGLVVAGGEARFDFFGVYDGHGGAFVAQACRERLHRIVASEVERRSGGGGDVDWKEVMEACFEEMDGEIVAEERAEAKTIGSTAVVAMVGMGKVVVANCGDSRAVLSRGGVAVQLSSDHKVLLKTATY